MNVHFDQLVYTSARTVKRPGMQVVATSPGVTDAMAGFIAQRSIASSGVPVGSDFTSSLDFCRFSGDDGRYCFLKTAYSGDDHVGRERLFSLAAIFTEAEFKIAGCDLAVVEEILNIQWQLVTKAFADANNPPTSMEPGTAGVKQLREHIGVSPLLPGTVDVGLLGALLTALSGGGPAAITADRFDPSIIETVARLLPAGLRRLFTFSTYRFDASDDSFHVVVIPASALNSARQGSPKRTMIDSSVSQAAPAAGSFAELVIEIARGDDAAALEELHHFAEAKGLDTRFKDLDKLAKAFRKQMSRRGPGTGSRRATGRTGPGGRSTEGGSPPAGPFPPMGAAAMNGQLSQNLVDRMLKGAWGEVRDVLYHELCRSNPPRAAKPPADLTQSLRLAARQLATEGNRRALGRLLGMLADLDDAVARDVEEYLCRNLALGADPLGLKTFLAAAWRVEQNHWLRLSRTRGRHDELLARMRQVAGERPQILARSLTGSMPTTVRVRSWFNRRTVLMAMLAAVCGLAAGMYLERAGSPGSPFGGSPTTVRGRPRVAMMFEGVIADTNEAKAAWIRTNLRRDVKPEQCSRDECVTLIGRDDYERMMSQLYANDARGVRGMPGAAPYVAALAGKADIYVFTEASADRVPDLRLWLASNGYGDLADRVITTRGNGAAELTRLGRVAVFVSGDRQELVGFPRDGAKRVLLEIRPEAKPAADGAAGETARERSTGPVERDGIVVCAGWEDVVTVIVGARPAGRP